MGSIGLEHTQHDQPSRAHTTRQCPLRLFHPAARRSVEAFRLRSRSNNRASESGSRLDLAAVTVMTFPQDAPQQMCVFRFGVNSVPQTTHRRLAFFSVLRATTEHGRHRVPKHGVPHSAHERDGSLRNRPLAFRSQAFLRGRPAPTRSPPCPDPTMLTAMWHAGCAVPEAALKANRLQRIAPYT